MINDFGSEESGNIYGFVIAKESIALWYGEQNFIMTESGKTFSRI